MIQRLRLEEMDRADAHIAMAETEFGRLAEGVEALKAKGQQVEELRREALRDEELVRDYKQMAQDAEESRQRDEFLVVQGTEDQQALQRRLIGAQEELNEGL